MANPANEAASMRVVLIVMPVVDVDRPSIGLSQLRSVVDDAHGDRVRTEVLYLSHEFASFMARGPAVGGKDLHQVLLDYQHLGLADWFFRQVAFPEAPDNTKEYFRRYFPGNAPEVAELKEAILDRRNELEGFLQELIDRHRIDEAAIVGFTSVFVQNAASFAMARLVKARNAELRVVMGGANCETPMGEAIARSVDAVDFVFSGPGLVNFPRFVGHLIEGEHEEAASLSGVFTAENAARSQAESVGPELDIDVPVSLDYEDFFASFDQHFPGAEASPMVLLETSRGCWWGERAHCTFCGLNGATMSYRSMAPERAVELYNDLFARYSDRSSYFFNVDNIMPKEYVAEVLPRIDTPEGARIFYEVKADLSKEDLRVMARAGVSRIQPGIEALNSSTLRLMKKGTTGFVNLRLLKNCLTFDIEPVWSLLVGFPGEGDESYSKYVEELPTVVHLAPPMGVAAVRFDRFSPYFTKAAEYGLELQRFDYYSLVYPFDDATLDQMAYYFTDANYQAPYIQAVARWMNRMQERVAMWRARWEGAAADRPRLELEATESGSRIVDTRGATPKTLEISAGMAELLEYLEREHRLGDVEDFARGVGLDGEEAVRFLGANRLVWREGERLLSLVMMLQEDPS